MAVTEKTFLIGAASGSGYDGYYETFAAYETAQAADLVTAEEQHTLYVKPNIATVGAIVLTDVSWVTSADCRIEIHPETAANGIAITDTNPDSSIPTTKSYVTKATAGYIVDLADDLYVYIDDLLFVTEAGSGNIGIRIGDDSPAKFTNCILRQNDDGGTTAVGFKTGTGFIGKFINCYAVSHGTGFVSAIGFDVDCSLKHDAVVNCTACGNYGNGFRLKNYVRAVNSFNGLEVASSGFLTDSNGNASVKCCASFECDFEDVFGADNVDSCIELDISDYSDAWEGSYLGQIASDSSLRKAGILPNCDGTTQDAFGTNRIKFDIGFYQTNLINDYDLETIFKDMGSIIKTVNLYKTTIPSLIGSDSEDRATQIASGAERLSLLFTVLGYDKNNQSQSASWVNNLVTAIRNYLSNYVAVEMMSTSTVVASILAELDNWLNTNSETVNAIHIDSNTAYNLDDDSEVTLNDLSISEQIKPQRIKLVCTSNTVAGSEYWSITGSEQTFDGTIQTGVAYESSNGLAFTLELPEYDEWDDDAGSYTEDDIILYDDVYYKCNGNHAVTPDDVFGDYASYWDVVYLVNVGDEIEIDVMADDEATIQMFFRDYFNFCFDNSNDSGTETILDSWAA